MAWIISATFLLCLSGDMNKCKNCLAEFEIVEEDLAFYRMASPEFGGAKFFIPAPTRCPDCREQRRLAQCNELNLYRSKCDMCNGFTLTYFPPHLNKEIYCRECWHSDAWDPCAYGQEYDPSRSFFEQWEEVMLKTPAQALSIQGRMINSEYCHLTGDSKNCYLTMHADHNEDCYYGYGIKKSKNCVDGFYNIYSELCYEGIDCHSCYGLVNCQDCFNCSNSAFLRDCVGCKSCFLCTGLRNKEYCIRNKQYSKEEYEELVGAIDLGSHAQYQKCLGEFKELQRNHIYKEFQGFNLENCQGMHMYNCKDTKKSFDCDDVEHGKFLYQIVLGAKDVYDCYQYGNRLELSYECSVCGLDSYNLLFCFETHWSRHVYYSWYIEHCKNIFGCSNMHHKEFCILNKQYSQEEYHQLVSKIVKKMMEDGEWGEFFPIGRSPFGYNKTMAQLFYQLDKQKVQEKGWKWDEYEPEFGDVETILASDLPDKIQDVDDSILKKGIVCEVSGKPFNITKQELDFYRRQSLPLPRKHWLERYATRLDKRNPRKFWDRQCDDCGKVIKTSYDPEKPEKVYCESCYRREVV